jgi:CheY-like chemotaxis protein
LLADDSLTIQRVVNLTFADEGIDVVSVGDGDAALRELADNRPDIVLVDVHMPGPSGYEICSLLRGVEETAKIPVILLVGSFEQFDPEEADRVGANAFVTKPFQSIRDLVDQVNELLGANSAEQTPPPVEEMKQANAPTELDTSDIDSLYDQSFAETERLSPEVAAEMAAAVMGSNDKFDDEMIETSYSTESAAEQAYTDSIDLVETGYSVEPQNGYSNEIPRTTDELDVNFDQTIVGGRTPEYEAAQPFEETLQMETPPIEPLRTDQGMHIAPTEELRHPDPFATTTDAFDLDDLDLLDLTPANAKEEYVITTPSDAVSQGSNKQVVTLSPELLEVIVQKVVEKISEKY